MGSTDAFDRWRNYVRSDRRQAASSQHFPHPVMLQRYLSTEIYSFVCRLFKIFSRQLRTRRYIAACLVSWWSRHSFRCSGVSMCYKLDFWYDSREAVHVFVPPEHLEPLKSYIRSHNLSFAVLNDHIQR